VLFLASDEARFVNGNALYVDNVWYPKGGSHLCGGPVGLPMIRGACPRHDSVGCRPHGCAMPATRIPQGG